MTPVFLQVECISHFSKGECTSWGNVEQLTVGGGVLEKSLFEFCLSDIGEDSRK